MVETALEANRDQANNASFGALDLIDKDLSAKIDQAIALDESISPFIASPHELPDLASRIDYALLKQPYGGPRVEPTRDAVLDSDTIFSFPFESILSLSDEMHRKYFDVFFSEFAEIVAPLKTSSDAFFFRDVVIQYSMKKDYLYFAMLASGARLSYRRTLEDDDQNACAAFMKKTLELLNDYTMVLTLSKDQVESLNLSIIVQTVETLTLTILLLTSDNASSMKDSWRSHLKGAKELLRKVFIDEAFPKTKVLTFCKCWFTGFEILAGLTAPFGGVLVQSHEIEKLSTNVNDENEVEILRGLQLVSKEDFNYIFGFHNKLLPPLIKLMTRMREGNTNIGPKADSDFVFDMISELRAFKDYDFTSIELDSKYPWAQTTHMTYVNAALLTVLTKFLHVPLDTSAVIELVNSILDSVTAGIKAENATDSIIFPLMMVQWPLLAAGFSASTDEQKFKLDSIFHLLAGWGSGSAQYSIEMMKRAWNNINPNLNVDLMAY